MSNMFSQVEKTWVSEKVAKAVLCYIASNRAYFTTRDLDKQWGDDWNDAPYEHNAGDPYTFSKYDAEQGKEPWDIYVIPFEVDLETPDEWVSNSQYSVEDINKKVTPWLTSSKYTETKEVFIYAGTTLLDFCAKIFECGGTILVPVSEVSLVPLPEEAPKNPRTLIYVLDIIAKENGGDLGMPILNREVFERMQQNIMAWYRGEI